MQTSPNQRLLEWVRKFRADLTPEGTITRLELYHSIEGSMGERLATFEMADRDDDEDPDDLTQEIWDECEADAATRPTGNTERYVIQAFRGDTREPDEQCAFTTRGKLVTALTGNSSEPPTEAGFRMGEARRTNDLHALVVRMCEATAGSAAVQLERERQENNRLRDIAFKAEQMRQEMLDRTLEREIARRDSEQSSEQMKMLFGTLIQMAPVILTRLLSPPAPVGAAMPLAPSPAVPTAQTPAAGPSAERAVAPAAPAPSAPEVDARDREIYSLLESVNPSQLQALFAMFDDAQKARFMRVYQLYREHPPAGASPAAPPGATSN